jgi:hypothetical protein
MKFIDLMFLCYLVRAFARAFTKTQSNSLLRQEWFYNRSQGRKLNYLFRDFNVFVELLVEAKTFSFDQIYYHRGILIFIFHNKSLLFINNLKFNNFVKHLNYNSFLNLLIKPILISSKIRQDSFSYSFC